MIVSRNPFVSSALTGVRLAALLTFACLTLGAGSAGAEDEASREACRAEARACHQDAGAALRACRDACAEGDWSCLWGCREPYAEARRDCAADALDCRVDCRDDVDPACGDACVDEFFGCAEDAAACTRECDARMRTAVERCREAGGPAVEVCVRDALAFGRLCLRHCRESHACRRDLRGCLSECGSGE